MQVPSKALFSTKFQHFYAFERKMLESKLKWIRKALILGEFGIAQGV